MSGNQSNPLNDEYLLSRAISGASPNPVLLDYGCGQGRLVALGLARKLDIYGVDTFEGNWESWSRTLLPETSGRIGVIRDGHIPFGDRWFDVVISNQVFEHTATPRGKFIAIFPHYGVWFEGHVGLYFAHWLARFPRLQYGYLRLCHKCGFGYYRDTAGVAGWAQLLKDVVFYHRRRTIERWWSDVFGHRPESMAHDWMVFRITASPRLRRLAPLAKMRWFAPFLATICHLRAGLVIKAIKQPSP